MDEDEVPAGALLLTVVVWVLTLFLWPAVIVKTIVEEWRLAHEGLVGPQDGEES